jgi:hypothetical protein
MGEIAFSLLVEGREEGGSVPLVELEPRIIWGQSL